MLTLAGRRVAPPPAEAPPNEYWRPGAGAQLLSVILTAAFAATAGLAVGSGVLVLITGGHGGRAVALIPLGWGTAVVVGLIWYARHCVVSVHVAAEGTLQFRTRIRTVAVYPGALRAVSPRRADAFGIAGLLVDGGGPRLVLPGSLDGVPELIDVARRWNPQARIIDL